jgi:acetyl-CoA carboxylase biotin carboxyl carrier protein
MPQRSKPSKEVPLAEVQALLELAQSYGASEIEVAFGETRIRVSRHAVAGAATHAPAPAAEVSARIEPSAGRLITIEAPMVGTFYRAPAPDAEPYVKEGDVIKAGQTVCIVEAMKLMNEVESSVAGRVVKILVENSQPVEYGQPLFLIEPVS